MVQGPVMPFPATGIPGQSGLPAGPKAGRLPLTSCILMTPMPVHAEESGCIRNKS